MGVLLGVFMVKGIVWGLREGLMGWAGNWGKKYVVYG